MTAPRRRPTGLADEAQPSSGAAPDFDPFVLIGLSSALALSESREDVARLAAGAIASTTGMSLGAVVLNAGDQHDVEVIAQLGGAPVEPALRDELLEIHGGHAADGAPRSTLREIVLEVETRPALVDAEVQLLLAAPISTVGHAFGTAFAGVRSSRGLSKVLRASLAALASQTALALTRVRAEAERAVLEGELRELYQQAEQRAAELTVLNRRATVTGEVAVKVNADSGLEPLLPDITALLVDTFGYHRAEVYLLDAGAGDLVLRAAAGSADGGSGLTARVGLDAGIVGRVAGGGRAIFAAGLARAPGIEDSGAAPAAGSALAVPIEAGGDVAGVLHLQSLEEDAFSDSDLTTASTVAVQLGVAIERAQLTEQMREFAVLEERARMAQKIHDTIAQGITGIVLQLEAGEYALEAGRDDVASYLSVAKEIARDSLQEARRSVWNLMPRSLEDRSLDAALAHEVEEFEATGPESASFRVSDVRRTLRVEAQAALLRICQEALANARRHAPATTVTVRLDYGADAVTLSVRDDGVGFDVGDRIEGSPEAAFGLSGMERRAHSLGGTVVLRRGSAAGTVVEASLPGR